MGERTSIAWTDHTFSPWWGCARVSPGCENCYAEAEDPSEWTPYLQRQEFPRVRA